MKSNAIDPGLPAAGVDQPLPGVPATLPDSSISSSTTPKLSSVLLVDDDATTNFLHKQLLSRLHVASHILVAEDGEKALALLAQACVPPGTGCPELIFLDINMPLMNGIEFLEAYQPRPPAQQLVIVVLTTSVHSRDLARLHQLSVSEVVEKPLTKEKLTAIMHRHFQRQLPTGMALS